MKTHKFILLIFIAFSNYLIAQNCPQNLNLNAELLYSGEFQASENIISSSFIADNFNVKLKANNSILLDNNFEVATGANLDLLIESCSDGNGFCFEDPLNEPFLINLIDSPFGNVSFDVFIGEDSFGNCWYKSTVNYSCSAGGPTDIGDYYFDSSGNFICSFGGFPSYPPNPNVCLSQYNINPTGFNWTLISACY